MKSLIKLFSALLIGICCINMAHAQNTKATKKAAKIAEINRIINSMNYVFNAQYALPARGSSKPVSDYDLTVTKDKLNIYLPYYGRVYSGMMDPTQGGIKLTTTHFDYKAQQGKKGDWTITIKPKEKDITDAKDVRELRLNVNTDGYASLYVSCYNRDNISFNGYVDEAKKEK